MATTQGMPGVIVESRRKTAEIIELPYLIEIQTSSYDWFIEHGLRELFDNFSPIEDYTGNISLEFLDYRIGEPKRSMAECRERDATFEAPLYAKVRLVNKESGEIKEFEVYMGEIPQMTERGTFLVNGAERVVISQLSRSPSVYFRDAIDSSGRVLYSAQVIPNDGAWVEIDTAASGVIAVKIGQARKFPVTTLLRALDYLEHGTEDGDTPPTGTDEEILKCFGQRRRMPVKELLTMVTRREDEGAPGLETHDECFALSRVVNEDGEVVVDHLGVIDEREAKEILRLGRKEFDVIIVPHQIRMTLADDNTHSAEEGLLDVYRKIRPGDPPILESAESLLRAYFYDIKKYDLSRVGRYMVNKKLAIEADPDLHILVRRDIVAIVRYLLNLSKGEGQVDDIDHLQNKRVKAVGELLQTQLRTGFLRMERVAKERMTSLDPDEMQPQSIISIKPITAAINSFFGSGQLSQFMDQINPLAELAHKRRLSALGPGGLSKQSAKLEVRDVHHSYYGRICPIETPEGPNVGLIGYLALHARLDEYGFIETPYRKVKGGKLTDEIEYLTADDEEKYNVATISEPVDERGRFTRDRIVVRKGGLFPQVTPNEVDYCDVSAKQVFSVATALIPFLENDDAVRALAGSNMQRQAVPLLITEQPLVRTGVEQRAAEDSGAVLLAEDDGEVLESEADFIKVRYASGVEVEYPLSNFLRTNMGTCISQKRLVRAGQKVVKGQPLSDGASTRDGQLALGRNCLVCFLPWEGYNFEDAVLISERLVRDDVLSSVHIEKWECEARDTKLGPEEITRDIPNVGDEALKDLDQNGVVRIGAEVRAEDILVGKVAPKGQSELTAEEKLVIAIFGKKAEEMRDVSLRVPHGEKGIVIATKIFSRYKYRCDRCESVYDFGKPIEGSLECDRCGGRLKKLPGDELKPGVNQLVRCYVAQKRKIMVGDKLTGRHGNKGVISKILPMEDMPYMADGRPVDICLNPLGVPSRMNIGQLLETHLGWVASKLGRIYISPVFQGVSIGEIKEGLSDLAEMFSRDALYDYAQVELNRFADIVDVTDFGGSFEELQGEVKRQLQAVGKDGLAELAEWLGVPESDWEKATGAHGADLILQQAKENAQHRRQFDARTGKAVLYDGRTGEAFNQPVNVGVMYILKLLHLVEDKIHARSTGPYSLITQQPLGGKAQMGGQRFGEMEVWALEAYGAAYSLQEMLTVKSDDVQGRVATYEAIVKDENIKEPGTPESFKILVREMQSLGLDVKVENHEGKAVDLRTDGDEDRR
ncbi:MAG: DNA-directed RNA polymerase subunit beta [Armatimonadetes bacterium]|nr:DNA-directed RNA polymerase subunit beta [Armatimonadota bacterium]